MCYVIQLWAYISPDLEKFKIRPQTNINKLYITVNYLRSYFYKPNVQSKLN